MPARNGALADNEHKILTKARAMLRRLDQPRPGEVSVPESVPGLSTSRTWSNADVDSDVSGERPASSRTKSIEHPLKTLNQDVNTPQAKSTRKLTTSSDKDSSVDDSVNCPESLDDFKWGSTKSASKRSKRQVKTFCSS
ncbi:hypothetical protein LTR93_011245 [Exophiala xenobiotica]|nr:hypothetical protein LTR93_011245 [Exophiala xenobiotica]